MTELAGRIGERIRSLRNERGLTQEELAETASISVSSLTRSRGFDSATVMMDAAGHWPICGSTGPSTAFSSITISSAASASSVPPDIA